MRPPRTSAVILWCGIQCSALVMAAAGIHLWPHQLDPPESLALAELLAFQIIAAALLFPVILVDRATLMVNLAVSIPLQQLAGLLVSAPQRTVWNSSGYLALWAVGLAGWARLARTDLCRSCLVAVATLLTLGGALLWYVSAETAVQAGIPTPSPAWFGPLLAGVTLTGFPSSPVEVGWTLAAIPLTTAAVPLAWLRHHPRPR